MKSLPKHSIHTLILISILAFLLPTVTLSQTEGSGNVSKQKRPLPVFTQIEVGSAFTVILSMGELSVIVETDENLDENIETLVDDGVLTINSSGIKNPTSLKVYVTAPNITDISLSGAARLESKGLLEYPTLNLSASGASRATIEVNTQQINTEVTGASRVILRGNAANHVAEVSGASSLNAMMLKTITTTAEVTGAGKMSVFAKSQLNAETSGAGSITYFDNPDLKKIRQSGSVEITLDNPDDAAPKQSEDVLDNDVEVKVFENGDSTIVRLGDLDVNVNEMDDETKIGIGKHNLEIDDEGNVKWSKDKKEKFDGHWGGVDIGINGLLYPDNKTTPPAEFDYLDLKMEKSIALNINIFEQNFNLINDNFGLTTGLGLEWNNYRFRDEAIVNLDGDLTGYIAADNDTNFIKSKMVTTYLTLPLMFELQSNNFSKINSFHAAFGVLSGLRIETHTKLMHENGKKQTDKNRGATSMNPFKLDLMARIGWGKINLYGTYSLVSLFKDGRGPEVYPFSLGITLVNW